MDKITGILLAIFALQCGFFLQEGLRYGVVRVKGVSYERTSQPGHYWVSLVFYAVVTVIFLRIGWYYFSR